MLKVENITKYYGNFLAVDNLSFEVNKGEIFGLLGANGAGKTTTFRMIIGLLEPTKGKITLNDKKIDYNITDKIGFLTEERSLLLKMTVKEQCIYYGVLKGMKEEEIVEKLKKLLKEFKIEDYIDKKIKELSKGNQQKVQFITSIINDPELLILDEPFSGLDPFNVELFKNKINELAKSGSMIIFSSHRMEHVELFCKKLLILKEGKSVLEGNLKEIKQNFRKKNIFVKGDIDLEKIKKIDGVISVRQNNLEFEIKVKDQGISEDVFKIVSQGKNITEYKIEEPSLNEIFIEKVGETYEK